MIEYLLILIITVAVVMAVSRGVGSPLQRYIQSNILDVVGCMMRVGELPHKSFGTCQGASDLKFNFNGAMAENSIGSNGRANTSGKAQNNGLEDDKSSNNTDEKNSANRDSEKSKANNRPRVRKSNSTSALDNGSDFDPEASNKRQIKLKKNANQVGEDSSFKLDGEGIRNLGENTTIIVRRKKQSRSQIISNFSLTGDQDESSEETPTGPSIVAKVKKDPSSPFSNRTVKFSMPKQKTRGPAEVNLSMESDFSFMNLIKWVLIIAIIVIFLAFAGTQLNSIRKGWTN